MIRRILNVAVVVALTASASIFFGGGTAFAACNTSASGNWSNNCLTDPTSNKFSRYTLAIQRILVARGFNIAIDGDYGQQTFDAVMQYQQGQGLTVDGDVGPQTWTSLHSKLTNVGGIICSSFTKFSASGSQVFGEDMNDLTWVVKVLNTTGSDCITSTGVHFYRMNTSAP